MIVSVESLIASIGLLVMISTFFPDNALAIAMAATMNDFPSPVGICERMFGFGPDGLRSVKMVMICGQVREKLHLEITIVLKTSRKCETLNSAFDGSFFISNAHFSASLMSKEKDVLNFSRKFR